MIDRLSALLTLVKSFRARAGRFFIEPHASVVEVGEQRRAQLLSTITLIFALALLWGLLSNPVSSTAFTVLLTTTVVAYAISRTRYYRTSAYILAYGSTSWAFISLYLGIANGFDSAITTTAHVSLVIASIILSFRGFVLLVILASVAAFASPFYSTMVTFGSDAYFRTSGVLMSLGVLLIGAYAFRSRVEQDRVEEVSTVNKELEKLADELEDRVKMRTSELGALNQVTAHRASQLQTIAELAQTIAQVKNINGIFPVAARLISEKFGFYHVGIFLVDESREYAVLQAANSEGGQRMLNRGHRLRFGIGVVGFAAQTGKPRIALDVGTDAIFFNNPDLPSTRSEIALPLISNGRSIGVLDVQSTEPAAFNEDDFQVLGTLASQLTLAIENARLLTDARTAATQVQEVYNEFIRTEWSRTEQRAEQAGFRYNAGRIELVDAPMQDEEILSAVSLGKLVANQSNGSGEKRSKVAIPVKLRGEVIGVLNIETNDPSRKWSADELTLMEAVADRAALAMENARLFQDARRRAAKERMIADASTRISNSLNVENILQATAAELGRVLGGSEVLIQLKNKDSA